MKETINTYIKYGFILILIYLAFLVVKPYLTTIAGALVLAFMAYPLQRYFRRKFKNSAFAAMIVTLILILVVVIPLVLFANILITEATTFYGTTNILSIEHTISDILNIELSDAMQSYIEDLGRTAAEYFLTEASAFLLSIPEKIINLLILIFILFYTLKDGEKALKGIESMIPLQEHYKKRFITKLSTTIESLFYGEIAISVLEGIVAIIGFWLLGVKSPVIWGVVVGLVALLPSIGPTIVWAPMTIIRYVQGDTTGAILVGLFGFLILSVFLDTILRAKVLGIKGHIHPIIILVGVLGGLAAFGIIGLILGPLFLVLLELMVEIYKETKEHPFE